MLLAVYHKFSKGGKALATALGDKKMRRTAETLAQLSVTALTKEKVVINWGCTKLPALSSKGITVINKPEHTRLCANKFKFFNTVSGKVSIPEFTDDIDKALLWATEGSEVLGRDFHGHSGADIVFFSEEPGEFVKSQFWVKYKKKKSEFRVHVMGGKIIMVQQKVLRTTDINGNPLSKEQADFRIRNHANGFIFQKYDITVPKEASDQALLAVSTVGLDFGAVDVIYNEFEGKAYVLEINTAPGLEGSSPEVYAEGLKAMVT